jgi:hypothetical protein
MARPKRDRNHRPFTRKVLERMQAPPTWWQYILAVPIVFGLGFALLYLVDLSFSPTGCDTSIDSCEPVFSDDETWLERYLRL